MEQEVKRQKTFKDLTGMQFGEWTPLEYEGNSMWKCQCSCGNIKSIHRYTLLKGKSKSCGHPKREGQEVAVGLHVWNWDIIEDLGSGLFKCRCVCGRESNVNISSLRYGYSKSCGCKQGEYQRETLMQKYGEAATNRINNPRELWQIEAISSEENLIKFIADLTIRLKRKPTIPETARLLDIRRGRLRIKWLENPSIRSMFSIDEDNGISSVEKELRDYIQSICGHEVLFNDRTVLGSRELDIYQN